MSLAAILFTILLPLANNACVPGEAIVRFYSSLRESSPHLYELPSSLSDKKDLYDIHNIEPLIQGKIDQMDVEYGFDRTYVIRFDDVIGVDEFISAISLSFDVELAEPNYLYELYVTPNDSLFPLQWYLPDISCPQGWDTQTGSRDVVIAVVDAGLDTAHPDLNANLWRNIDEILDGTDTDGNGYVDDIVGWDWTDSDNDPTPTYFGYPGWPPDEDHGTWCNGIANGVTDNGIGIAGVAFNVKMMGFRCTATGSPGLINTNRAVSAIHYARLNGANVISMSWGGGGFSTYVNEAIQQAHFAGLVLCGAAGNEDTEGIHYPSGYDNVIAVAGTDHNNHKWTWGPGDGSNYGTWVDVCAPAVDLLGTDPDPNAQGDEYYESAAGTSGSCPQVAGLAALLFSKYPDSSNTFIENLIFETCDPIDDSLFEEGKLGQGKINVFKALARFDYCWPLLCGFSVDDSIGGNDNGRPEPGDTCRLTLLLTNDYPWSDGSDLEVIVSSIDERGVVNFIDSTALFCSVTSGDTVENSDDDIVFEVLQTDPGWSGFTVRYVDATPPPYPMCDSFELLVGFPLLLVDDDCGSLYEDKYIDALDTLDVVYEYWSNQDNGEPGGKLLSHAVIIWFTGDDSTTTLTSFERNSLADYLSSGGKLFLSGQNIAQDIAGESFLEDYLRCSFLDSAVPGNVITGKPGDEVGDGLNILTSLNQTSRDEIEPLFGADTVVLYDDSTCAGVKYQECDRKVVFFSWGLEGVIDHCAYSSKAQILERVLYWLDTTLVGIEEETDLRPSIFDLRLEIYPNPFSTMVTIDIRHKTVDQNQRSSVSGLHSSVRIYDLTGRLVRSISLPSSPFPFLEVTWDGRDFMGNLVPSGVYFVSLSLGGRKRLASKIIKVSEIN